MKWISECFRQVVAVLDAIGFGTWRRRIARERAFLIIACLG
jgi:hypothetical protein